MIRARLRSRCCAKSRSICESWACGTSRASCPSTRSQQLTRRSARTQRDSSATSTRRSRTASTCQDDSDLVCQQTQQYFGRVRGECHLNWRLAHRIVSDSKKNEGWLYGVSCVALSFLMNGWVLLGCLVIWPFSRLTITCAALRGNQAAGLSRPAHWREPGPGLPLTIWQQERRGAPVQRLEFWDTQLERENASLELVNSNLHRPPQQTAMPTPAFLAALPKPRTRPSPAPRCMVCPERHASPRARAAARGPRPLPCCACSDMAGRQANLPLWIRDMRSSEWRVSSKCLSSKCLRSQRARGRRAGRERQGTPGSMQGQRRRQAGLRGVQCSACVGTETKVGSGLKKSGRWGHLDRKAPENGGGALGSLLKSRGSTHARSRNRYFYELNQIWPYPSSAAADRPPQPICYLGRFVQS